MQNFGFHPSSLITQAGGKQQYLQFCHLKVIPTTWSTTIRFP